MRVESTETGPRLHKLMWLGVRAQCVQISGSAVVLQDFLRRRSRVHIKKKKLAAISRTCVNTQWMKSALSSITRDPRKTHEAGLKEQRSATKTHHFECEQTRQLSSGRARLTDPLTSTFCFAAQPRRKEAAQCTMGKPATSRSFEKKLFTQTTFK